jgi:hypothetical protein
MSPREMRDWALLQWSRIPLPPRVKDLEPKERIQTYLFTKSKFKIIDSRIGFEIESG